MEAVAEGFSALLDFLNRYGQGLAGLGTLVLAGLTFLSLRWAYEQEARRRRPKILVEVIPHGGVWSVTFENYSEAPVRIAAVWVSVRPRFFSRWRRLAMLEFAQAGDETFLLAPTKSATTFWPSKALKVTELLAKHFRVALELDLAYVAHPRGRLTCRTLLRRVEDEPFKIRVLASECKPVRPAK